MRAGGVDWHVQVFGAAASERSQTQTLTQTQPLWLLLHGTGSSGHSWRDLVPALVAAGQSVLVPDLPGHGFSGRPRRRQDLGLAGMSGALAALLDALALRPHWVVGHSAGAAVAARLCLDAGAGCAAAVRGLVSLNGAWLPPAGLSGWLYTPMARLLALSPLVPRYVARRASRADSMQRLVDATGSRLDEAQRAWYARLVADPDHVAAVLDMMAAWDLRGLVGALARLHPVLHLVAADRDRTVPPQQALQVAQRHPAARLHRLAGLGHLAHEEDPAQVARLLLGLAQAPPLAVTGLVARPGV